MKKIISITMVLALSVSLFSACDKKDTSTENSTNVESNSNENDATYPTKEWNGGLPSDSTNNTPVTGIDVTYAESDEDMFTNRDINTEIDTENAIEITLNGTSATASSNTVNISDNTVTITEEATYIVSGNLDNGMLVVNADETAKLQIVFDNVSINNNTGTALYIIEADKVFVTLLEGSNNFLSNGGEFVAIDDNNIDGAIYSKQDLTFNGEGTLTVTSTSEHGIVCKDDLVFTGGTYNVTAASHGLDANDSVRIVNTTLNIDAGKDGIHAENSDDATLGFVYTSSGIINIESEGDAISGSAYVQIVGGEYDLLTGGGSENGSNKTSNNWGDFGGGFGGGGRPGGQRPGGQQPGGQQQGGQQQGGQQPDIQPEQEQITTEDSTSIKGIKSSNSILISGGTFNIDSADDSIHANYVVTIDGGEFTINSGDDGVHADEYLNISEGTIDIKKSYEGLEGHYITVSGGDITIVASDDGLNAAGGNDASGTGNRDGFGGGGMSSGNGSILISGGSIYMNASGDGLDANGTLEITGGYTVVCGPTNGDTSVLDYDKTAIISGGTFIGTGASMMAQTFTASTQGVIALNLGNVSAGTQITIEDSDNNLIVDVTPKLSYQIAVISTPDIVSGNEYTVTIGDEAETFKAN